MSDRLLKESDVMRALYKLKDIVIKYKDLSYHDGLSDAFEAIQDLPSANRPNGKWIEIRKNENGTHTVKCNQCDNTYELRGHAKSIYTKYKYRFCPFCGARMKGTDDAVDTM